MPTDNQTSDTPRYVSRGVKPHYVGLSLDSLYLSIEYPHTDVFEHWSAFVPDLSDPRLYEVFSRLAGGHDGRGA
jgi:hypothetical protein